MTSTQGSTYRIPPRAMGNKLRDIYWVEPDQVTRHYLISCDRGRLNEFNQQGEQPFGYYLEGNYVKILPQNVPATGYIEMSYDVRPSDIIISTSARKVSTVDTTTRTIVLTSDPPASWTATAFYDIHSIYSGAECKMLDMPLVSIGGQGHTAQMVSTYPLDGTASYYTSSTPNTIGVAIGDYVCLAGECALPPIPLDMVPILVEATALEIAKSLQDGQAMQVHAAELKEYQKSASELVRQRIDTKQRLVVGTHGLFNKGNWSRGNW